MKAKDLKNSILQMAIEGKLVPQDSNDEPASVLLERIREEKHKLIAEGKAKFPKGGESIIYIGSDGSPYEKRVDAKGRVLSDKCIADEVPFEELPEGWAWARFQTVCLGSFTGPFGSALHKSDYVDNGIPVINPANIRDGLILPVKMVSEDTRKRLSSYVLHTGDFIIGRRGEMGRAAIVSAAEDGWLCGTGCFFARTTNAIKKTFWKLLFASSTVTNQLEIRAVGTTMKNLNLMILDSLILPVPPLAEQRRIVERVDELMPLVEEYGGLEDAREALDAALPGRLRKSVLQLAARGGLAPQDPADEPAGVLLERIRAQRRRLVAEGKMRAPKGGESIIFSGSDGRRYEKRIDARGRESEPVCVEDEIPFEIPEGWEWARLSSIASFGGGKTPSTSERANFAKDGVLWVTSKDMKQDHIDSTLITLSDKGASGLTLYPKGSLIMVTRSGILRRLLPISILDKPATVNQDQKAIVPDDPSLSEWLLRYLQASDLYIRSKFGKDGTTVESVVFDKVKSMLVPVPPLAEQRRIVERFDMLEPLITNQ